MYGLTNKTISNLCRIFAGTPSVQEAIIYGSRARGDYHHHSDIDISLRGNNITDKELTHIYFQIDDLLLPYTIDLCVISQLRNEWLKENIINEGKLLYSAS